MKTLRICITCALVLGISASSCKKDAASPVAPVARPAQAQAAPPAAKHGEAGVRPGSHEDWCEEHGVPESLCTRCNPSLVAAFKATGDWCREHGLPESQCRICSPNLTIQRPPESDGAL